MQYFEGLGLVLKESLSSVWGAFAQFVPILLLAIVVFIVGMLIASVVGKAVSQLITATKVDKLFESAGFKNSLSRAGLSLDLGKFFGVIIKWFIAIVFLMASLQILNLTQVSGFIGQMVLLYLPKIIVIVIILILAAIIADVVKKIVITSSKIVNVNSSEAFGSVAKYAVWVMAVILILSQFEGIDQYAITLFTGIVAFLVISLGLSFGLGGKEAASKTINRISDNMSTK